MVPGMPLPETVIAMTLDRGLTIFSVVLASFATAAATVQGYVSWHGRRDALTTAALAEVVKGCQDINYKARSVIPGKGGEGKEATELLASAVALDVVIDAIYPTEFSQIYLEVLTYLSEDFQAPIGASKEAVQDIQTKFVVSLGAKCKEIIRREIQG